MSRSTRIGLMAVGLLALSSLLAPWLPLADPAAINLDSRLQAPSWFGDFAFGSDAKGRDLLARLIFGARVSLAVGLFGSFIALAIGVPWGAFAGLRGGRTERTMMRIADGLESLPMVVVVLFMLSVLSEYRAELATIGIGRMHVFYFAVGFMFWVPTARVARAEALRLRKAPFVQAAYTMGASTPRIIGRHLLPNMAPSLLVMVGISVPRVILMEAFLSFLGLGVEPPAVSWGLLAADGLAALNPLIDCWWLLVMPAAALGGTLLTLNLLADNLRDHLGKAAP